LNRPGAEWRQFTLGRLLLFVFSAYEERMLASYRAAGFPEVRQAHFNVSRHIDIANGSRISDLATRAGVTKGAMGQLVADCERLGLVTLSADPADARAKIVELSKRGRALMDVTRRASRRIEGEFSKLVGAQEFAAVRAGLIHLREKMTAPS
jgi:DNA-binding MarR family transcriptional regulator